MRPTLLPRICGQNYQLGLLFVMLLLFFVVSFFSLCYFDFVVVFVTLLFCFCCCFCYFVILLLLLFFLFLLLLLSLFLFRSSRKLCCLNKFLWCCFEIYFLFQQHCYYEITNHFLYLFFVFLRSFLFSILLSLFLVLMLLFLFMSWLMLRLLM